MKNRLDTLSSRPEEQFWSWFRSHEESLFTADSWDHPAIHELLGELGKVNEGLRFEFGPEQNGKRIFAISAGGVKELMPQVEALVAQAPVFDRWEIARYCRRKEIGSGTLTIGDETVAAEDVYFSLVEEARRIGVTLHLPEFREGEEERWGQIAFYLLDAALGELIVMTCVGGVSFAPLASKDRDRLVPLKRLPEIFSRMAHGIRSRYADPKVAVEDPNLMRQAESWWEEVRKGGLAGEELIFDFSLYLPEKDRVEVAAAIIAERYECEVTVEEELSLLGRGYLVSGRTARDIESLERIQLFVAEIHLLAVSLKGTFSSYQLKEPSESYHAATANVMAHHFIGLERYGDALGVLEEGIEKAPGSADLLALLAYVYAKLGEAGAARLKLADLEPVLLAVVDSGGARWNAARAYSLLGDAERSLELLKDAVQVDRELFSAARTDPDLSLLRDRTEFKELLFS